MHVENACVARLYYCVYVQYMQYTVPTLASQLAPLLSLYLHVLYLIKIFYRKLLYDSVSVVTSTLGLFLSLSLVCSYLF